MFNVILHLHIRSTGHGYVVGPRQIVTQLWAKDTAGSRVGSGVLKFSEKECEDLFSCGDLQQVKI